MENKTQNETLFSLSKIMHIDFHKLWCEDLNLLTSAWVSVRVEDVSLFTGAGAEPRVTGGADVFTVPVVEAAVSQRNSRLCRESKGISVTKG